MKQTTIAAIVTIIVLVYLMSFSLSVTEAQYQGQTLNERENVNATSSDEAVYNLTNGQSDIQTMKANNGTDGTSANGTTAEIITNASQQPLAPLQSPPSLQQEPLPPIMQPPQQPIYCYYPNYNPQCIGGQTIRISIVPGAATQLNQAFQPGLL